MAKKKAESMIAVEDGKTTKDVVITDKQKNELDLANKRIIEIKVRITDLTEQLIIAQRELDAGEQRRYNLFDEKYLADAQYKALLENIARLNGIDPNADPEETGVKYEFDGVKFISKSILN